MSWEVLKIHPSPLQNRVTLINRDPDATTTTDYHQADALARRTLTGARLVGTANSFGTPLRTYASQAY